MRAKVSSPRLAHARVRRTEAPLLSRVRGRRPTVKITFRMRQRYHRSSPVIRRKCVRAAVRAEPLSSLDDERRETILPILERIRDELRIPMVYVSHNRDEITRLADEVVRIDSGRVTGIERRALQSRQSQAQNRWHLRARGSKESPGDHRTNASLTACGGAAPSESAPEQKLGSRESKGMLQVPRAVTSNLEH